MIVRERISAVGFNGLARERHRFAGIIRQQRVPRRTDETPDFLALSVEPVELFAGAIAAFESHQRLRRQVSSGGVAVLRRLNRLLVGTGLE